MAKTLNVNGTQMANVTANGVAMNRVYMNGVLVFEKSSRTGIELSNGNTAQEACSRWGSNIRSIYIIEGDSFTDATAIYDSSGQNYVLTNFYSNGSIVRFWDQNSETFTSNNTCV